MGYENREYFRDEEAGNMFGGFRGFAGGGSTRSIVTTLIIINVAIFVLDMFSSNVDMTARLNTEGWGVDALNELKESSKTRLRWLADFLALKTDILFKPWYWWQFLTYGFAHSSITTKTSLWHIVGNMIVLFFLGRPIENRLGRSEFLKFYLLAILASGFGYLLIQMVAGRVFVEMGANQVPRTVVGASGAVSAVVAAFVVFYPKQKLLLWGILPMPAWVLGILIVGMDLLNSFNPDSNVAGEAHLVGLAFGAAYVLLKWNLSWLKFDWLSDRLSGKPNLKIHEPSKKEEQLKQLADQILQKIADQGESSLTARERRTLNKYSKSVRKKRN